MNVKRMLAAALLSGLLLFGCTVKSETSSAPGSSRPAVVSSRIASSEPAAPSSLDSDSGTYVPMAGPAEMTLKLDRTWYFSPLIGGGLGYISVDGSVVWDLRSGESAGRAEEAKLRLKADAPLTTTCENGRFAVAGGRVVGYDHAALNGREASAESRRIDTLVAGWERIAYVLEAGPFDGHCPVAVTTSGDLTGLETSYRNGQYSEYGVWTLTPAQPVVMAAFSSGMYQEESPCLILTGLTKEGTLFSTVIPSIGTFSLARIEEIALDENAPAFPLPDYSQLSGVVAIGSLDHAGKLVCLRGDGTLLLADGAGGSAELARGVVRLGRASGVGADGEDLYFVDQENSVVRLRQEPAAQDGSGVTFTRIGYCSDWRAIAVTDGYYAVMRNGTVENLNQAEPSPSFYDNATDVRSSLYGEGKG